MRKNRTSPPKSTAAGAGIGEGKKRVSPGYTKKV
jgi:hypothetical protein